MEITKPENVGDCENCPIYDMCMYDVTGICLNQKKRKEKEKKCKVEN